MFVFCKYFLRRHPIGSQRLRALLRSAGQDTLGIYLVHPLVIKMLRPVPMPDSTGLTIVLRTLMVFAVSCLAAGVLRRLPILKHTVT